MKRILFLLCCLSAFVLSEACTSAIIGADKNPYGRPLLWKHRDTSTVDNKLEYIPADGNGGFAFVALYNASDSLLNEAWMGMNEYGFAIMNTASYNLKDDDIPEKDMDKEGFVITKALRTCKTVDDFGKLLEILPKPLGVEANFGVIDAYGEGAFFETNNYKFHRENLADSDNHVLIRTNYSHSGRPKEGYGFIREANAEYLLEPFIEKNEVTAELLTEGLSRSFLHTLLDKDFAQTDERWVIDQDFIPRYKSTATIVIEGCEPLDSKAELNPEMMTDEYVMWTGLGYPPCSEIIPVWCRPDGVEDCLRGIGENGHSPQCDIVKERRSEVFPITMGNGDKYIDMYRLYNEFGTGYIQKLVPRNLETYRKTRELCGHRTKDSSLN